MPAPHPEAAASLVIRAVIPDDAEAVAELSDQLGYPTSAQETRARIELLARDPERLTLAAILHGQLVGWIDSCVERHLQAPDMVNINGLVVRDTVRGARIGQQLCHAVEQWALSRNIPAVRVRSQIKREDAHRFYVRDGYRKVKTSFVFEKTLRGTDPGPHA